MSAAPQLHPVLRLYAGVAWGVPRLDQLAVGRMLAVARIRRSGPPDAELAAALGRRVRECRDFCDLRGVQARRGTVLRLAGRSLARDAEEIGRFDLITEGGGEALLRALADLIDERARGWAWWLGEPAPDTGPLGTILAATRASEALVPAPAPVRDQSPTADLGYFQGEPLAA